MGDIADDAQMRLDIRLRLRPLAAAEFAAGKSVNTECGVARNPRCKV